MSDERDEREELSSDPRSSNLEELQQALARGDLSAVRRHLLTLDDESREVLEAELGKSGAEDVRRAASRRRRSKRGRVVVLHGIMGSQLDSVDRKGDADRVWTNYWRLIWGRIADLELSLDGGPARPDCDIRLAGLHRKTYLRMLLELDQDWHVLPYAYDWRGDVDLAADGLAAEILRWAAGEPVHLVAHSMGGLVSRRFTQRHLALWRTMADPDGLKKGGRLVMLGTPNHGSFSIPMALSGAERVVKGLAKLDVKHDLEEILGILGSFLGSYQMLPSPLVDLEDQHERLFRADTWGALPIRRPHLERARRFHEELARNVDRQRFVYVAGYDRKTPHRILIDGPGRFLIGETWDGDGRVPHVLGLLRGVPTFWVNETHGDLPRNEQVLRAMNGLLAEGTSAHLASAKPARRAVRADLEPRPAEEVDPLDKELTALLRPTRRARPDERSPLTVREAERIEDLVLGDYLGHAEEEAEEVEEPLEEALVPAPLTIEVHWADVTRVDGDVFCVGHYEGVPPQNAEAALDAAVSGKGDGPRVIEAQTRRGALRGALGDVNYFPWGDPEQRHRVVAVAGMGRPGTFGPQALRELTANLAICVSGLPNVETVCTVLIGSGEGSLTLGQSVRGLLLGLADAHRQGKLHAGVQCIRVVELFRDRAAEILDQVRALAKEEEVSEALELTIPRRVTSGRGGRVTREDALLHVLHAAARGVQAGEGEPEREAAETLLAKVPTRGGLRREALEHLTGLDPRKDPTRVTRKQDPTQDRMPTRISILEERGVIHVAAISNTATVAERAVPVDPGLIQEIVDEVNDPDQELRARLSSTLTQLLVPREFRALLRQNERFVLELDRTTARIHWELLARELDDGGDGPPLPVAAQLARQLRTAYSPAPSGRRRSEVRLRALVVGDPGDPAEGSDLPGARVEALEVRDVLQERQVEVKALIGAANAERADLPPEVEPATRLNVLDELIHGQYDLLHYSGHGDFHETQPDTVGWLFGGGLLTSREIGRIERAPALVVANACLSGRISDRLAGGGRAARAQSDRSLVATLADEFFHLGVRNYLGTSWEVNDWGAVLFARRFYEELLGDGSRGAGATIGAAVQAARKALWDEHADYGKLWAAYQHYGDPDAGVWES